MERYYRIIGITGSYFYKEYTKSQKREVRRETVKKFFLENKIEVEIIFEDSEQNNILVDYYSEIDDIKKYLGRDFIPKK